MRFEGYLTLPPPFCRRLAAGMFVRQDSLTALRSRRIDFWYLVFE